LLIFSLGGVLSYQYSRRLILPDLSSKKILQGKNLVDRIKNYVELVRGQKPFISFAAKRFVFMFGFTMAAPILPLYFVRQIHAPDSWIAIFSTSQTLILFIGYFLWLRISRSRGSRFILISKTFFLSFYPMVIAISRSYWLVALFAAFEGLFESGLNLVFFDELMKTVPEEHAASFVSIAQSIQFLASMIAPIIATSLADQFSLSVALITAGSFEFIGFLLFFLLKPMSAHQETEKLEA
jgi:MFS family permease